MVYTSFFPLLAKGQVLDPEILQSGFRLSFLICSGEFLENCLQMSQRIAQANLSRDFLSVVSPGLQAPPKFTPKIHAQNCWHSSPISDV